MLILIKPLYIIIIRFRNRVLYKLIYISYSNFLFFFTITIGNYIKLPNYFITYITVSSIVALLTIAIVSYRYLIISAITLPTLSLFYSIISISY